MTLQRIFLYFFYMVINVVSTQELLAKTLSEKADEAVSKIVKNIKTNVPEDSLDIYEKFSRKTINSLYLENTSDDEINFLINALTITFISINEKNKNDTNSNSKIQIIKNDLNIEKEKILKQTLKESYQLWLNNCVILKRNTSLIKKHLTQTFEDSSVVILDLNLSDTAYKAFKNSSKDTNKFIIEEKSKQYILDYLQSSVDKESKLIEQKYNSTFNFGKEILALEEKDIKEFSTSIKKEILATIGNVLIIGNIAEIDYIVKRIFQATFEKDTFQKISKNAQKICLQIYFRHLQKSFINKPDFNILHYGKDIDLEIIKKSITEKTDIKTIELLFKENPNEGKKILTEFSRTRESWLYFTQFLNAWTSALTVKVNFESSEESKFVSDHINIWIRELQPYIDKKNDFPLEPCNGFETLSDCLDEMFLFDKDFILFFIQDEIDISNKDAMYELLTKKNLIFENEYVSKPEIQTKYNIFKQKIKKWSQENYTDKLSLKEKQDIILRKQYQILITFLIEDVKKNNSFDYKNNRFIEISRISYASEKKLNELKLISSDILGEEKLAEMKLKELDIAQLNYFQIARKKNPIFSYFDFENNSQQVIWDKYKEYHKNSIQENEKQAYDLVVKILLEESLKKISK